MAELNRGVGFMFISDMEKFGYGWTAKEMNREIYWTGWYPCGNNIQWTTADDGLLQIIRKKEQIKQEKT